MDSMSAGPDTSPALRCSGLDYRYPAPVTSHHDRSASSPYGSLALDSIDLEIPRGELVVLAGLSGSGKTTLLKAACGLVPHFHGGLITGELEVAGLDVRHHGPAELATEVGLVAQDPESQVVSTTVVSELRLPLELRGVQEGALSRAVEETALSLGIDHLLERQTSTLSGGELQRVALGAAMVTRPTLLLLDEATSQLDPVAGDELIWTLRRLNEEFGVAVICCEHRLERCLEGADRALSMRAGAVVFDGSPDHFLEWSLDHEPDLATPGARVLRSVGEPAVSSRKRARLAMREHHPPALEPEKPRETHLPELALSLKDVEVTLGGGEACSKALQGVDLDIYAGERVALMGANGAGKSTLLRTAVGLIDPDRGQVEQGSEGVAMLPQRPSDMLVRERVCDELPGDAGAAALRAVGLVGFEDADPRDLSGGERQRLAVALVIAGRSAEHDPIPSALLLDEPTRGMDRGRKRDLEDLIRDLSARGCAPVIATHDVEFAAGFADRVVLLARGKVLADGSSREILSHGVHFSTEVSRLTEGLALSPEDYGAETRSPRIGSTAGRKG